MGKDEETALCVRKKAAVVFGENHILDETVELIKIFVLVSKRPFDHLDKLGIFNRLTALSGVEGLKKNRHSKQMKLNC